MKGTHYIYLPFFSIWMLSGFGCKKSSDTTGGNNNGSSSPVDTFVAPATSLFKDKVKTIKYWRGDSTFSSNTYYLNYTSDGKLSSIEKLNAETIVYKYLAGATVLKANMQNGIITSNYDTFYFNNRGYPIQRGNQPTPLRQWTYYNHIPDHVINYSPPFINMSGAQPGSIDTVYFSYDSDGDYLSSGNVSTQYFYDKTRLAQAADMFNLEDILFGNFPLPTKHLLAGKRYFDGTTLIGVDSFKYSFDAQGRIIATYLIPGYGVKRGYYFSY